MKEQNWNRKIAELEEFFSNPDLSDKPIKVNAWTTIKNCHKFIEANLKTVKANNGNKTFLPYLHQLEELKKVIIANKNQYDT